MCYRAGECPWCYQPGVIADEINMSARRVALTGTLLAVAILAVILTALRWSEANKIATISSALAAVAAVGVAIWAAFPAFQGGKGVRVSHTGKATAGRGGRANSGVSKSAGRLPEEVQVDRSGNADASNGGEANTGVQLN